MTLFQILRKLPGTFLFYTFLSILLVISTFLNAQEMPEGLKVGEIAPNFKTVDYLGNEVHLKDALKEGPVVLMFYRGNWCPYCNKQLSQMQDSLQLIKENGGSVIAVTPETVESIGESANKTNAKFRIIHDQNLEIMKAYHVSYQLGQDVLKRYKSKGIDIKKNNGENGAYLPVPATYIINQEGKIVFAFFDPDYRKRATVARILKNL